MAIRHGTKPLPITRQKVQDFGDHMASLDPANDLSEFQVDMNVNMFQF